MNSGTSALHIDFRVVYIADARVLSVLRDDFLRAGAQLLENGSVEIGERMTRRLGRQKSFAHLQGATAVVTLFSDVIAAARELPRFDADLVIVDERETAAKGDPQTQIADATPVTFDAFREALRNFTPKAFHYPSRRIVVVVPESAREFNRAFQLGIANVRAVIHEPESSVELFLFATRELDEFRRNRHKAALCLAGGGVDGYLYTVGVCAALDEVFKTKKCNDFDLFTGVSSGSIVASCLSGGMTMDELMKQLYRRNGRLEPFSLGIVFDFAVSEVFKRLVTLVRAFYSLDPVQILSRLVGLVPMGLFKGDKLRTFISSQLKRVGVEDNLASLPKPCFMTATDLDTGECVIFGEAPWQDVKISQAVRASTALPPFYLPERINGHWFTDGQVRSSYNFQSAIRRGAGLIVLVDPMVAYTSNEPGVSLQRGGYFVAVQAIKSLVESRSSSVLLHAMDLNPDVDFIQFQPTDEVMEAMAGNPMNIRIRTEVTELGYRGALIQILSDYEAMARKFGKHGFVLKTPEEIKALLRA